jgi:hypothetical protein
MDEWNGDPTKIRTDVFNLLKADTRLAGSQGAALDRSRLTGLAPR